MAETYFGDLQLPISVILGAIAAAAYVIAYARHRRTAFTLVDALILVSIMAIATAAAMPLLGTADESAKSTALEHNLRTLRGQIELYKLEHRGAAPVLFKGGFPQLTHATNADGVPGPPGKEYPYGPYLPGGIPVNPYTGVSVIELTETFPPTRPTATGGWLYHQQTGQITADVAEFLQKRSLGRANVRSSGHARPTVHRQIRIRDMERKAPLCPLDGGPG